MLGQLGWMRKGMLHIDGIANTQLRANFSERIELNDIATCFPQMQFLAYLCNMTVEKYPA